MTDNIFADARSRVLDALCRVAPGLPPEVLARVEVTPAREAAHGDMATNAAMVAAKAAGQKPAALAAALSAELPDPLFARATPAGPGFVNLVLHEDALRAILPAILRAGDAFGASQAGQGAAVNVEYVSANPTGPMHIGHCRGAVVGDALANLLSKAGFRVTKEYVINDAGAQVVALAWAAYWRYLQAIGSTVTEAEMDAAAGGLQYKGDYLVPVGEAIAVRHGRRLAGPGGGVADPAIWLDTVRTEAVAALMEEVRGDLALLGITHDVFTSERALVEAGRPDATLAALESAGLLYRGVLEPPKGKTPEDWEPREQLLFRATAFGDDVDRPLRKSDGSATYFMNDIAYHADKAMRLGPGGTLIDVWGADHGGYVARMKAAVRALPGVQAKFEIVLCQIVRVMKDGLPVRMSKRAGTYVALRDLLDWVGRDAVRFTMLTRKPDAMFDFDVDLAVANTRDNPSYYVQYVHARCRSVLRRAIEEAWVESTEPGALAAAPLQLLTLEAELAMMRRLAAWPRTVEGAALAFEPHRIAFYLYDLASDFNILYTRGRDDATLRFLTQDRLATTARLALVAATAMVIRSGLAIMGVEPVEELR